MRTAIEEAREWVVSMVSEPLSRDIPITNRQMWNSLAALLERWEREAKVEALKWVVRLDAHGPECPPRCTCSRCFIKARLGDLEAGR
jgi:hypothetical protein